MPFTAFNLAEISLKEMVESLVKAQLFEQLASSSRAPDRTVSTLYMLLFGAAFAMRPTPELHRIFLIETRLFTAEVVSH